jgi:phosphopantetheine--protein transferase-like protein
MRKVVDCQAAVNKLERNNANCNLSKNNVFLLIAKIDDVSCNAKDAYHLFPKSEIVKYSQNFESFNSSIKSRFLLYKFLSESCQIDTKLLIISKNDSGKPFFLNNEVEFSISHSGHFVVVALSFGGSVGVDFEANVSKTKDVKRLAKRFFHPEEYEFIEPLNEEQAREKFIKMWTKKEAIVKCLGSTMFSLMSKINTMSSVIEVSDKMSCNDVYFSNVCIANVSFNVSLASENFVDAIFVVDSF